MHLTSITATRPGRLSKAFRLNAEAGQLEKLPGGQLLQGMATRIEISSVTDLAVLLSGLSPADALTYGVSEHAEACVVSRDLLSQVTQNGGPPIIARTREFFAFPKGPAILMLDYDPQEGQPSLTSEQLRALIYSVAPAIEHAPHLVTPSASSFIYKGDMCLKGPSGLRMLIPVTQGTDIPRAGETLFKRLWLAGHGYIGVSTAGSLLIRGPLDGSVWQPERLDFCGGAHCEPPLEQKRPAPVVFNPDSNPLDTRDAIKSLSLAEEAELKELITRAKKAAQPSADEVRQAWIETHVKEHLKDHPDADSEKIKEAYRQAAVGGQLLADFVLYPAEGDPMAVGQVLDAPEQWHGKRFADPLEPEYRNDKRIAFLNLRASGRPYLYSNAHGGRKFYLLRQRTTVRIVPGERVRAVEQCLKVLRKNGQYFEHGRELAIVTDQAEVIPRDERGVLFDLDTHIRFEKWDSRKNDFSQCDCKPAIAAGVMAARASWQLPTLKGIATAPTMDPTSNRIIDQDGYDAESGLLLCLNDPSAWPGVPTRPTDAQVETAVQTLWAPYLSYPFDGAVSKGVWLGTNLTAVIRSAIATAPATAVTSPTAGTGKTGLAKCLAEIVGETPALLPDAKDGDEIRKRLLGLLRQGKRLLIIDNVTATLDSSALCVLLTAETYQDRVLGVTEVIDVPTRTMVLITGNNVTLRGDLCRRVVTTRINPEMETPWKRKFEFDPVQYVRDHRIEMVQAALMIIRAGIQRGPELDDRTASFETWSDTVRRAVVYVRDHDMLDVDDPIKSIDEAYSMDPETTKLAALLSAWHAVFPEKGVKTADLVAAASDGYEDGKGFAYLNPDLHAAVEEIAVEGRSINVRRLGRWIERNRDRIIDGMSIKLAGEDHRAKLWRIIG